MTVYETWDLDSIFPGGSASPQLADFLQQLTTEFTAFETAESLPPLTAAEQTTWVNQMEMLYGLGAKLNQAAAFIECLVSQDVKDDKALQLQNQVDQFSSRLGSIWTEISALFVEQDDTEWHNLLSQTALREVAFHLNEERAEARQKMDIARETLLNELATDGYHGWGRLYGVLSGDKQVQFQGESLSLGQLQNRFFDDPDRFTRQQAFDLFEDSWADLAKPCGMALNYQAGFRLTSYKHRAWQEVLQEPLLLNRMKAETLEAMWSVVDAKSSRLLDYFAAKAKLFEAEQLTWYDFHAPVGEVSRTFTYEEAGDFVVEAMQSFNPDIAQFCRMAMQQRWVEAENRPHKRAGGFCTTLPLSKQSRIFMTYNGSYNGLLTLAHEFGHAYHNWVMRDLPHGARRYGMSVAETASTFNELVVTDATLRATDDPQEQLSLLGSKLNDATSMLMDIRARFDFEMAFFEQRAKGSLSVAELNELMLTTQKKAFKDGLGRYHPLFWASKLHFYITDYPFYNFPYTFGYLFSNGVYAQALAEGQEFVQRYIDLLRDTGSMSTEQLAHTHLGVDLTRPEFWETAVDRVLADVEQFVTLVDEGHV